MDIEKDKIQRDQLAYSMLRRVIIRADFTSMLDTDKMVSLLNEESWFNEVFNNYSKLQILEDNRRTNDSSEENTSKRYVRRFNDCVTTLERPERNVILDITDESVCVDIQCDDKYTKIDAYLLLAIDIIIFIICHDKYVKLNRLAIRKFDAQNFPTSKAADEVFEYFDQNIMDFTSDAYWQRTYTDNFIFGKTKVKVNYTRMIKISDKADEMFMFVLDIDTFLDSDMIENKRPGKEDLTIIFFDRLNNASFDLFKRGVKLEFLKSKMK